MPPGFAAFAKTTLAELSKQTDGWMKGDLIAWRDFWFVCLTISTLVVVAGLIGEYPELRYEIGCIYRRRFKLSLQEKSAPDWVKVVGFIGWLLIVLGVLGEGVFAIIVTRADASLQSFNDALLAETNWAAGSAKASSEVAAWAAHTAQGRADAVAASATKLARELRATAEAQKETAEAQRRTAQGLRWVTLGVNRRMINQTRCVERLKKNKPTWNGRGLVCS